MALTKVTGAGVEGVTISSTTDTSDQFILTNTDTGSSSGPDLVLHRKSTSSAADSDGLGRIDFRGLNDANEDINYATIYSKISDASDGTEDGEFYIQQISNGSYVTTLKIDSSGRIVCGRAAPISSGGVSSDHTFEQLTDARWAIATHHDQTSNYGYAPYYATAHDGTGNHFLFCRDTGATRLKIQSDGDVANHDNAYGATSDERIKQDIKDANSQWDDIKALKVRNFKKKDDVRQYGDKAWEQIGVIAQELEAAGMTKLITESPPDEHDIKSSAEFGTLNEDGTIKEVKANVKDVKYSVLYMKAVKALQEAMIRIETLETKVKALEAK